MRDLERGLIDFPVAARRRGGLPLLAARRAGGRPLARARVAASAAAARCSACTATSWAACAAARSPRARRAADGRVDRPPDRVPAPLPGAPRRPVHRPRRVGGRADGARLRPRGDPARLRRRRRPAPRRRELDRARAVRRARRRSCSRTGPSTCAGAASCCPPSTATRSRAGARRSPSWPRAEVAAGRAGEPLRTLPRMQALTLDVILRVVLGPVERPELRAAIRRALDMTASLPRLVAMSLHRGRDVERVPARRRATSTRCSARELDRGGHAERLAARRARRGRDPARRAARPGRHRARRRPRDDGRLARLGARAARPPPARRSARVRDGDDAYLDAVVKEVLRVRPVLSIAARRVAAPFEVGGHVLPPGVHVAPCIYLAHRRPEAWPEPTAFRPERFLGRRAGARHLPPVRRRRAPLRRRRVRRRSSCARCCAPSLARFALAPGRAGATERMSRGSVTLRPSRGGTVLTEPLQPSRPCRSSAATTA